MFKSLLNNLMIKRKPTTDVELIVKDIDSKLAITIFNTASGICSLTTFYPDLDNYNKKLLCCIDIIKTECLDDLKYTVGEKQTVKMINFFINEEGYYVDCKREMENLKHNCVKFHLAFEALDASKNADTMHIKYMMAFVNKSMVTTIKELRTIFPRQRKWYQIT